MENFTDFDGYYYEFAHLVVESISENDQGKFDDAVNEYIGKVQFHVSFLNTRCY